MPTYQEVIVARTTDPDPTRLRALLVNAGLATGVQHIEGSSRYVLKRSNGDPPPAWDDLQLAQAQSIIEGAPACTGRTLAEARIDAYPAEIQALLLVLIDQINILRQRAGLTQLTPAQAVQAIKDKLAVVQFRA